MYLKIVLPGMVVVGGGCDGDGVAVGVEVAVVVVGVGGDQEVVGLGVRVLAAVGGRRRVAAADVAAAKERERDGQDSWGSQGSFCN